MKVKVKQNDVFSGFKMWVDDVPGLMHVSFHLSINEELHGLLYVLDCN